MEICDAEGDAEGDLSLDLLCLITEELWDKELAEDFAIGREEELLLDKV